jgi:multidrug efflux pump subunit AcrA (membrane-fusion protein)
MPSENDQPIAPPSQTGGGGPDPARAPGDLARRALATGLELAKNATRARTLDELQFILVNDTRALIAFDRSLLIVHMDGKSVLVATNNQPKVDEKAGVVQNANSLAEALKDVNMGLILFAGRQWSEDISEQTAGALKEYMEYSRCSCMTIIPLTAYDHVIGHLILEFFGQSAPGEVETYTLMNMVPFFSSALAEKWVMAKRPRTRALFMAALSGASGPLKASSVRTRVGMAVGLAVLVLCVFLMPVTLTVGGKAEVAPDYEYCAFVEMDGIVDKVLTREGDSVKKDQVLAELQENEIDYKIREAKRLQESYKAEVEILRNMAAENPAKLAESQLVAIKGLRAKQELDFLNWQRNFLSVKSPVDGTILTKKLESLIGKKFKAGEPFCKVAPHDVLVAEVFIRESDIAYVAKGQPGEIFFNYQPSQGTKFVVKTVSPVSETLERVGSVFRVRGDFVGQPGGMKPGMQGTAHIDTQRASLFFVLTRRLRTKMNELLVTWW